MRLLFHVASLLAILMIVGCGGDKRATISGKVTVAGKGPLTGGNIRFISVADPNIVGGGQIKADGTYEVLDAPVGECKVVIDNTHLDPSLKKAGAGPVAPTAPGKGVTGPGGPSGADKAKVGKAPEGADVPAEMGKANTTGQKYVRIDTAYAKPETTTITFKVEGGSNTKDFDVK